ncbi:hypothetical protein ACKWTF_002562 [Chironomus riparius]
MIRVTPNKYFHLFIFSFLHLHLGRDSLVKHFLTDALQRHQVYVSPDPRVANPIAEFGIPPQNFANNLLYWTRATLELDYTQIAAAIANNNVNTDELGCNHDIGCHCCPF